jgi:hypothetical protein
MPRPKIQHPHEHRIEGAIQKARRERNASMKAKAPARGKAALPGPEKFCVGRGPSPVPIPPAVKAWIRREEAQQLANYEAIAREVAALAPMREQWVREFYARITGPRGFSVHAGQRRTIRADEVPARPKRPWRVLW